jgi:hypothetical protein
MRCSHCGFENPPLFKFCGQCGAPLGSDMPSPKPVSPFTHSDSYPDNTAVDKQPDLVREAHQAERRQLKRSTAK